MSYRRLDLDDVESLGMDVQAFSKEVSIFVRLCRKVGGPLETAELQVEIDKRRHQIITDYSSLVNQLKNCRPSPDKRTKLEKIKATLSESFNTFNTESSRALEKEKKTIHEVEERQSVGGMLSLEERQSMAFHNIAELNEDELRRRQQEIEKIESEMVAANKLFKDLGQMVIEQGDMLNQAEQHVEVAKDETAKAVVNLHKARWYQGKARSKLCWILIIVIVVVAVIVLIALGVSGGF